MSLGNTPDSSPADEFALEVLSRAELKFPKASPRLVDNNLLAIKGHCVHIDSLRRAATGETAPPREDVIDNFLEHVDTFTLDLCAEHFSMARSSIVPKIVAQDFISEQGLQFVAHCPFVNDTWVLLVLDAYGVQVSVPTESLVRWGMQALELEHVARENLCRHAGKVEYQLLPIVHDLPPGAVIQSSKEIGAANLLHPHLYETLIAALGPDFFVAAPSSELLVALPSHKDVVEVAQARIQRDYSEALTPLSPKLFVVTQDGIAGTV